MDYYFLYQKYIQYWINKIDCVVLPNLSWGVFFGSIVGCYYLASLRWHRSAVVILFFLVNIKFQITQNDHEWRLIESAIQESSKGKTKQIGNKSYSQFIAMELSAALKQIDLPAIPASQISHTKKGFEVSISDENADKINTLCYHLNCTPSVLIARMILQPHISGNKIKESILLLQK